MHPRASPPPIPSVDIGPSRRTVTVAPNGTTEEMFTVKEDCPDMPCTYQWSLYCRSSFTSKPTVRFQGTEPTAMVTFGSDSADVDTADNEWLWCYVHVNVTDSSLRTVGTGGSVVVE